MLGFEILVNFLYRVLLVFMIGFGLFMLLFLEGVEFGDESGVVGVCGFVVD